MNKMNEIKKIYIGSAQTCKGK